jgi:hypothetical protein
MKSGEKITLGVLILMPTIWAGLPAWLLGPAFALDPTTTAAVGLSLLLVTGVLEWEDLLKARSAWDTLMWFAALVMMATFLGKLGLTTWFSQTHPGRHHPDGRGLDGVRRPAGADLLLRPLLLRQHHRACHRHVRGVLRRRRGARRAPDAARPAARVLVVAQRVAEPTTPPARCRSSSAPATPR